MATVLFIEVVATMVLGIGLVICCISNRQLLGVPMALLLAILCSLVFAACGMVAYCWWGWMQGSCLTLR